MYHLSVCITLSMSHLLILRLFTIILAYLNQSIQGSNMGKITRGLNIYFTVTRKILVLLKGYDARGFKMTSVSPSNVCGDQKNTKYNLLRVVVPLIQLGLEICSMWLASSFCSYGRQSIFLIVYFWQYFLGETLLSLVGFYVIRWVYWHFLCFHYVCCDFEGES